MKVWKIASRWSDDGNSNSILDLFKKHKISFVYNDNIRTNEVSIGDLLAISDGKKIVGIGKVLKEATSIEEFNIPELDTYNQDECTVGFKIDYINLSDSFYYEHMGRFHELHGDVRNKVSNLWGQRNKRFSINAHTCTLKYNDQNGKKTILGTNTKYIIPIYQRPYSWTDEQIKKFLTDIFLSYWGSDGNIIEEPMFIGTMQLTEKDEENNEQQVIDGQQRLTTFLILLRVIQLEFPKCSELQNFHLDWLLTKVNNGTQQKDFDQLMAFNSFEEYYSNLNTYVTNALFVKTTLLELISDGQKELEFGIYEEFNIDKFVKYILSKIYFVIIETYASVSKTLQIFKAINTTGLDLNGGDIFKLRMYLYLCDQNPNATEEDKVTYFEQLNGIYEEIDTKNKEIELVTDIFGILEMYKYILVAKYDLPKTLYFYETNRFFEELFDTLLNENRWDIFKNIKDRGVILSIKELEEIIQTRFQWHLIYKNVPTAEDACSLYFIRWSRYSRYDILAYLFTYKFNSEENFTSKLFLFLRQLSKLFIIYSIRFQKLKSEIYYTFMYEVLETLVNKSSTELIELINSKIGKIEDHNQGWYDLNWFLSENLTENAKRKHIICRLSAMLDENYTSNDIKICDNLFKNIQIDIEHIQSYNDRNGELREDILNEWGVDINSIGNLMVLEQDKNRSIGNSPYELKTKVYPSSVYRIVRNQAIYHKEWTLDKCKERKHIEASKILKYLFN